MQNRYTGDIGDFAKYGLLRALSRGRQLGVAWYLYPDEAHTSDGRHIDYLRDPGEWRSLDAELFDGLRDLIAGGERSVAVLEQSGLLPGAVFASEMLKVKDMPSALRRGKWRAEWFEGVIERLTRCDIVFADPDNGLYPDDKFRWGSTADWKRQPLCEAIQLCAGRVGVLYHHNTRRKGGHRAEIRHWLSKLPAGSYAFYWQRYSNRTFFVVNPDQMTLERLAEFAETWKAHGQLIKPGE